MPSVDPIERSTLRVMMTIVSPMQSSAMIAALDSRFWTLVALRKRLLWIVVTPTTSTSASTIPSSRNRSSCSATTCERARGPLDRACAPRRPSSRGRLHRDPVAACMIASSLASAR